MPIGSYKHRPLSEEAKKKLSEFWLGKKKPESQRLNIAKAKVGSKNPLWGVKPSKETLLKRSISLKGKLSGEKNPMYGKPSWNKGLTKNTNEIMKRIANSKFGIKRPEMTGEKSPNWKGGYPKCIDCGKTLPGRSQKRCSKCDGIYMRGPKCHLWQGGKSFEPYTSDWRNTLKRSIRERDGYTCQICGENPSLCCHHIDYDKKNCNPTNLITLCRSCHTKTNTNRDYWTNYFLKNK